MHGLSPRGMVGTDGTHPRCTAGFRSTRRCRTRPPAARFEDTPAAIASRSLRFPRPGPRSGATASEHRREDPPRRCTSFVEAATPAGQSCCRSSPHHQFPGPHRLQCTGSDICSSSEISGSLPRMGYSGEDRRSGEPTRRRGRGEADSCRSFQPRTVGRHRVPGRGPPCTEPANKGCRSSLLDASVQVCTPGPGLQLSRGRAEVVDHRSVKADQAQVATPEAQGLRQSS